MPHLNEDNHSVFREMGLKPLPLLGRSCVIFGKLLHLSEPVPFGIQRRPGNLHHKVAVEVNQIMDVKVLCKL